MLMVGRARVEIIHLDKVGEYYQAQLAVNGVLAPSMDVHASAREQYKTEASWLEYLTRSSETLIQMYGDARHQRLDMQESDPNTNPYLATA